LWQKIFEGHIINTNAPESSILAQKYAGIFVLGHYLFLEAHSFPQAMLSENCLIPRRDNVHGQISVHIFTPNGGYCLFITATYTEVASGRTHVIRLRLAFNFNRERVHHTTPTPTPIPHPHPPPLPACLGIPGFTTGLDQRT